MDRKNQFRRVPFTACCDISKQEISQRLIERCRQIGVKKLEAEAWYTTSMGVKQIHSNILCIEDHVIV